MKKELEFNCGFYVMIGIIITVISFMLGFYLFYEYFFEHYYWHNKIFLYKKLKSGELFVVENKPLTHFFYITEYVLNDGSVIWVYPKETFTYSKNDYSYIGLFVSSPIMSYYNKKIIKLLNN